MKNTAFAAILLLTLGAVASAQEEKKKPDDILQLQNGGILVGKVASIGKDHLEILVRGEEKPRRVPFTQIQPYSIYRAKLERIDKKSGAAWLTLGVFCKEQGIPSTAAQCFETAARLDPKLADECKKLREEARNEDARSKFEEARRLHAQKKWKEANDRLRTVMERYHDTPYAEQARKEIAKIADEIRSQNEEKKKQLQKQEQARADQVKKKKQDYNNAVVKKAVEFIESAQKSFADGLAQEAKNVGKADRAWKEAEKNLLLARRNTGYLLKEDNADLIKQGMELDQRINALLVRVYYRLGRMWSVELSYSTALAWLNKGLLVPHDEQMDRLLNEVLLTLSQVQIRRRAHVTPGEY